MERFLFQSNAQTMGYCFITEEEVEKLINKELTFSSLYEFMCGEGEDDEPEYNGYTIDLEYDEDDGSEDLDWDVSEDE